MERLKENWCRVVFESEGDMLCFLKKMESLDQRKELRLNTITTGMEDGDMYLIGENVNTGMPEKTAIWPFCIKSLEKRSGDTAFGHRLMTEEQILKSMNNYWKLHEEKEHAVVRIRGGKALALDSMQYEPISQAVLLDNIISWLEERHGGAYSFKGGEYTHLLTSACFDITDAIGPGYRAAWKKAGLSEHLLDSSKITVQFLTDDTENCSAKAIIEMVVGGARFLIGNPISVAHRAGFGGAEEFRKALDAIDMTVKDELEALSDLMTVDLLHPENAALKAMKKSGVPGISKKACKELIEDMFFGTTETAYFVYLFLHGILDTSVGKKLPSERKLRITTALRTLLKEDWKTFDVPSAAF